ncbi:MAG: hypothetical protein H7227_08555 [Actinobacteria bacterium]|nr:hypothetical protein [Actinomycetota bacterium]
MIFGFLFPIVFIGLIVLGVRRLRAGPSQDGIQSASIRRFFQYSLLYGLIVVVGNGLSGLLGLWIANSDVLVSNQTELARNVSFVVVGIPMYLAIALWARRQYVADPAEAKSFGWSLYFTLATLTFLIGASLGLREVLSWASGIASYQDHQMAQFIIWGGLWGGHWWTNRRLAPPDNSRAHNILGSLYGLGFLATGLIELLSGAVARALNFGRSSLFIAQENSLVSGAVTALVGLLIWLLYWLRTTLKATRDVMWLAYVMLVGAGGGLVMAIISLSVVLYSWLVWLFGTPTSSVAPIHFNSFPVAASAAVVGGVLWWYHRTVLHEDGKTIRTEVRRVYEYLMSAIGLLASAIGVAIVLVALVDAFTESNRIAGAGSRNTLLAALTLLVVGSPIWGIYWNRIQKFVQNDPDVEHASPSRRVYLFVLFGIGGLIAAVTLLIGVFLLFDDIFKGNFGAETIRRIRVPLAMLLSTGGVAGYHWLVYRTERESYALVATRRCLVVLVGPHDSEMLRVIGEKGGVKVQAWSRSDSLNTNWTVESILQAIHENEGNDLLILSTAKGLEVIWLET